MSTLRQTSDGSVPPSQLPEVGTESVWLEIDNPEGTPVEPLIDDYPYEQREYTGTIFYREIKPSIDIRPDPEEFEFRYRAGSGLFIIEGEIKGVKSRKIFTELNQSVSDLGVGELSPISSKRLGEWSFIFSGTSTPQRVVEDIYGNEVDPDELEDLSRKEIANNFNLNRGRVVFYYEPNDEHINVSYEDGVLNFTQQVSIEGREFVLEKFEKHVVNGDIIEELE
jgi:hypothetical protein